MAEAERQIQLILNPPTAEVGATYKGKVVNITKFGAFVNILPGRDGLVHISKLGGGKRIDRVEDVLALGDELEVVVDDIDPNGKVSLTPVGAVAAKEGSGGGGGRSGGRSGNGRSDDAPSEGESSAGIASTCRSRTPSTTRSAPSSVSSVPPPVGVATTATVAAADAAIVAVGAGAEEATAAGAASPAADRRARARRHRSPS